MNFPLELTHVPKNLMEMKRKKESRQKTKKHKFSDTQLLYLENMAFEHIPVKSFHWGGISEMMEYTYQDLDEVSIEECMEAHRKNVTRQPGTGDLNFPEHICVALRAQSRIVTHSQADSYYSEDEFFAEHKKDLEDELAYIERNEPTDPTEATSSIAEKKKRHQMKQKSKLLNKC